MTRALALILAAVAAACTPLAPIESTAPPKPSIGPEIIVRIPQRGQAARTLVEHVGARCWLDGIVRGAQMIVDRQTGRIIIVGDTSDLLAADFLPPEDGRSRIRLSGPVVADQVKANRLVETLDLAVRTGKTDCPIAAS